MVVSCLSKFNRAVPVKVQVATLHPPGQDQPQYVVQVGREQERELREEVVY
jgi:hypothetical protein